MKWKVFHLIAYTLAVFYLGFYIGYELLLPVPRVIEIEVPVPVEVEVVRIVKVPERIEVPVIVVVYRSIETVVYTNIYCRRWNTLGQFINWYQAQHFTETLFIGDRLATCNDYAQDVQETALKQGYAVSIALTLNGYCLETKVTDITGAHAGLLILVGKDYYWVEPQPQWFSYIKVAEKP